MKVTVESYIKVLFSRSTELTYPSIYRVSHLCK